MEAKILLRAIRLSVKTARGTSKRTIPFRAGLNILSADNTSGKSTVLQSIIFALGLEKMLSPTKQVPLASVMTDEISLDGAVEKVVESCVELEFENAAGTVISVRRYPVHATKKLNLLTVFHGANITSDFTLASEDYYVRDAGGATRERGFHRFLDEFLDLDLPKVTKTDGSSCPLYLETIFPFSYVEQKHGWGGVQVSVPTYFGISEVNKRATEYILGLSVLGRASRRQRLRSLKIELESEWSGLSESLKSIASAANIFVQGLDTSLTTKTTTSQINFIVTVGAQRMSLSESLEELKSQLGDVANRAVPTVGESAEDTEHALQVAEERLLGILADYSSVSEEQEEVQRQIGQVDLRISALDEDLRKHEDSRKLRDLGADFASDVLVESRCPTCHHFVEDGMEITSHPMTVDESLQLIRRQKKTFEQIQADYLRISENVEIERNTLAVEIRSLRRQIRAGRDSLISANSAPSIGAVAQKLQLEYRVEELEKAAALTSASMAKLERVRENWQRTRQELSSLEGTRLPMEDREILRDLQNRVVQQLQRYGFSSVDPGTIEISQFTYRPSREGFDLGYGISASDMVRLIWAYLFGLLEVGATGRGNHLGLLVFDEPKQHDAKIESYTQLLQHAATVGVSGAQVIFATSESEQALRMMLGESEYSLFRIDTGEKLITTDSK